MKPYLILPGNLIYIQNPKVYISYSLQVLVEQCHLHRYTCLNLSQKTTRYIQNHFLPLYRPIFPNIQNHHHITLLPSPQPWAVLPTRPNHHPSLKILLTNLLYKQITKFYKTERSFQQKCRTIQKKYPRQSTRSTKRSSHMPPRQIWKWELSRRNTICRNSEDRRSSMIL